MALAREGLRANHCVNSGRLVRHRLEAYTKAAVMRHLCSGNWTLATDSRAWLVDKYSRTNN